MGAIECCKGADKNSDRYKNDRTLETIAKASNNSSERFIVNDNIKVNFEIYLKKRLDKLIDFDYAYCLRSNKNVKHKRRILINTEGSSRRVHFFSYSPGKIPYLISSITINPNIHVKDVKFLTKENSEFYALVLQEKGRSENIILINCLLKKETNKDLMQSMYSDNCSFNNTSFNGNFNNNNINNNENSKDSLENNYLNNNQNLLVKSRNHFIVKSGKKLSEDNFINLNNNNEEKITSQNSNYAQENTGRPFIFKEKNTTENFVRSSADSRDKINASESNHFIFNQNYKYSNDNEEGFNYEEIYQKQLLSKNSKNSKNLNSINSQSHSQNNNNNTNNQKTPKNLSQSATKASNYNNNNYSDNLFLNKKESKNFEEKNNNENNINFYNEYFTEVDLKSANNFFDNISLDKYGEINHLIFQKIIEKETKKIIFDNNTLYLHYEDKNVCKIINISPNFKEFSLARTYNVKLFDTLNDYVIHSHSSNDVTIIFYGLKFYFYKKGHLTFKMSLQEFFQFENIRKKQSFNYNNHNNYNYHNQERGLSSNHGNNHNKSSQYNLNVNNTLSSEYQNQRTEENSRKIIKFTSRSLGKNIFIDKLNPKKEKIDSKRIMTLEIIKITNTSKESFSTYNLKSFVETKKDINVETHNSETILLTNVKESEIYMSGDSLNEELYETMNNKNRNKFNDKEKEKEYNLKEKNININTNNNNNNKNFKQNSSKNSAKNSQKNSEANEINVVSLNSNEANLANFQQQKSGQNIEKLNNNNNRYATAEDLSFLMSGLCCLELPERAITTQFISVVKVNQDRKREMNEFMEDITILNKENKIRISEDIPLITYIYPGNLQSENIFFTGHVEGLVGIWDFNDLSLKLLFSLSSVTSTILKVSSVNYENSFILTNDSLISFDIETDEYLSNNNTLY